MLVSDQEAMLLHGGRVAEKETKTKPAKKSGGASRTVRAISHEEHVYQAIDQAIASIQKKLTTDAKPSVADLVRLLQLKKDLEGDRPKDVTVRWVDECIDNSLSGE